MGIKANLPAKMTEEIRGGTRGGQAHFSWDAIKSDHSRMNYLGNSVKAPSGRWSEEKDVFWYTKGERSIPAKDREAARMQQARDEKEQRRKEEIRAVKLAEEEMLQRMLAAQQKQEAAPSPQQPSEDKGRSREGDTQRAYRDGYLREHTTRDQHTRDYRQADDSQRGHRRTDASSTCSTMGDRRRSNDQHRSPRRDQ